MSNSKDSAPREHDYGFAGHGMMEVTDMRLFPHGWPSWLWPLGRFVNRHKNPFTGRWHRRAFGG